MYITSDTVNHNKIFTKLKINFADKLSCKLIQSINVVTIVNIVKWFAEDYSKVFIIIIKLQFIIR